MSQLCAKLSETAPVWGKLLAPWAEYVAHTLWASTSPSKSERRTSTPLTQQHRRLVKGRPSFAEVKTPKPERLCRGGGKKIPRDSMHCGECNLQNTKERIVEIARIGRIAGHSPAAIAKQAETQRRHGEERRQWNPTDIPAWLTAQAFSEKVQPTLAEVSATAIAKKIGVSIGYAGRIREGYRPHPRHWHALAGLVGIIS